MLVESTAQLAMEDEMEQNGTIHQNSSSSSSSSSSSFKKTSNIAIPKNQPTMTSAEASVGLSLLATFFCEEL